VSRRQVIMHHHMMLTPNQIFALKSRWAKEQLRQTATIARQTQHSRVSVELEPLRWGGECWAAATAIRIKRGMSRTKPHRRSSVDFTIIFLIYNSATRVFLRRCQVSKTKTGRSSRRSHRRCHYHLRFRHWICYRISADYLVRWKRRQ
jgi:hypothetical protein